MTLQQKFGKIVESLLTKTERGEVMWEPSIGDSFITSRPNSSIAIEQEGRHCKISLYDDHGRRLETLGDVDLPGGPEKLRTLFAMVRRSALDVEAVADSWLA